MDIVGIAIKGVLLPLFLLVIGVWIIKRIRADLVAPSRSKSAPATTNAMEAMMTEARAQRALISRDDAEG